MHERLLHHHQASMSQGPRDWYRIQARAGTRAADVDLYDEIGWYGFTASDFVRDLRALDVDELHLHVNSPGGSVYDGWTRVPDRYKVEDPNRPDPNKATAGIFRFVW